MDLREDAYAGRTRKIEEENAKVYNLNFLDKKQKEQGFCLLTFTEILECMDMDKI